MLTTREIATLIWFVPVGALIWRRGPGIRRQIRSLVAILLQPVILVPGALFTAWMVVAIYAAAQLGAWDLAQLKDTLYWLVPAYTAMFGAVNSAGQQGFFRRRVRNAVGLSAFFAFYLNLATLDLVWELLLVPALTLLGLLVAVGGAQLGGATAISVKTGKRAAVASGLIVIVLVAYVTLGLLRNLSSTDWVGLVGLLALPVWLTLWSIPFLWAISAYAEYDRVLAQMRIATSEGRVRWNSLLALLVTFRFRRGALHTFSGRWPRELAVAHGFHEALAVLEEQRATVEAEAARRKQAADALESNAGAVGLDDHGRQLDKREFKETVEALEHLASSQMGWYRNRNERYEPDLLEHFADVFRGDLPPDHGITMKVSRSGQSWYAWRRTPSGLCFGIGSAGRPPDQRFYEGMDPPSGFPKVTPGWLPPHEHGPNWAWGDDPDGL